MKKAFLSTVQRVVIRGHDKRFITSGSKAHMSSLPLAETGWELEPAPRAHDYYTSSVEGALDKIIEATKLGHARGFCTFEHAVRVVPNSEQHTCHLCGRGKFLNELCPCSLSTSDPS